MHRRNIPAILYKRIRPDIQKLNPLSNAPDEGYKKEVLASHFLSKNLISQEMLIALNCMPYLTMRIFQSRFVQFPNFNFQRIYPLISSHLKREVQTMRTIYFHTHNLMYAKNIDRTNFLTENCTIAIFQLLKVKFVDLSLKFPILSASYF